MNAFLSLILWIIVAQTYGVWLTWQVDCRTWRWRQSGPLVLLVNLFLVCLFMPTAYLLAIYSPLWLGRSILPELNLVLLGLIFCLLVAAAVQTRQFKITLRAAFCGTLFQFLLFEISTILGYTIAVLIFNFIPYHFSVDYGIVSLAYCLTTRITYGLLTIFRPTLDGARMALRDFAAQNFHIGVR